MGMGFPAAGCWKVAGRYPGHRLDIELNVGRGEQLLTRTSGSGRVLPIAVQHPTGDTRPVGVFRRCANPR